MVFYTLRVLLYNLGCSLQYEVLCAILNVLDRMGYSVQYGVYCEFSSSLKASFLQVCSGKVSSLLICFVPLLYFVVVGSYFNI